jgi:hypothetical protein
MNNKVRRFLIEVARKRGGYIHYQELSDKCSLGLFFRDNPYDRLLIGKILGEISAFEHNQGRPLLSALVITKTGEEGDGFFKLCEELGFGSARKLKSDPAFSAIQMNRCYGFWQNDNNYLKYKDI